MAFYFYFILDYVPVVYRFLSRQERHSLSLKTQKMAAISGICIRLHNTRILPLYDSCHLTEMQFNREPCRGGGEIQMCECVSER